MPSACSRRTMTFTASAFGLALVLAACGSSSKTSTAASGTTAATSGTTAAPSSSPSSSAASSSPLSAANSAKGQILVDAHGKSLYVFDKDTAGKIACLTGCTGLWPPLTVPSGSSAPSGVSGVTTTLGTVMRPDGTTQISSDGRPLYTYAGDAAAGDVNGDGFMGIWHVAKVAGNGTAGAASSGSANTTATTAAVGGY